jgi:hypothetical protein
VLRVRMFGQEDRCPLYRTGTSLQGRTLPTTLQRAQGKSWGSNRCSYNRYSSACCSTSTCQNHKCRLRDRQDLRCSMQSAWGRRTCSCPHKLGTADSVNRCPWRRKGTSLQGSTPPVILQAAQGRSLDWNRYLCNRYSSACRSTSPMSDRR